MEIRQLRYFAAIFEHGTLSSAAEHMRVAASALSHHLANLEHELGAKLFVRLPRGMEPTAAGDRLYAHARSILRAIEATETDIRQTGGRVAGAVSIGMAFSAVKAVGVELARRVLDDFPDVQLSLTESLSGATLMHLMRNEVDLALLYNPPADPALKTRPVLEEELICIGKRDIIGETDAAIGFSDVLDLPIVLLRQGISSRAITDDIALLKRMEAKAKLQMNSVQAIGGALLEGLGCTIGTKLILKEELARGSLHYRPIHDPELKRMLCLCELANRPPKFALEAVRSLILDLVAQAVVDGTWEARLVAGD